MLTQILVSVTMVVDTTSYYKTFTWLVLLVFRYKRREKSVPNKAVAFVQHLKKNHYYISSVLEKGD